ncbi:hypothetical protein SAMD00019534_035680 [Acytostelium subglobosum LB1]|uniref:hypothetical protein n=1 Tax=Acytostelium subglobosum LB1 TaxID=1410327 RepID=UPI0006448835|nr:hypothetical protein SAMD00019534_035680 [Acytostelium subglobosum LB1]GAM20393.1 hypothetical protein SAMD00019534_035680 [Acytostelium subglobosum LB1]|eukprot:XP_012759914.1 hypothetical protein SAMD00019534_035680 [Acytostelium subglobosum LB1]
MQDFDALINSLNDRKMEMLTQLAVELESHKQMLEKNRDRAQQMIEDLDRRIKQKQHQPQTSPKAIGLSPSLSSSQLIQSSSATLSSVPSIKISKSTSSLCFTGDNADSHGKYLKLDHMALLKESIDVISWIWTGEFQGVAPIVVNNSNSRPSSKAPRVPVDEEVETFQSPDVVEDSATPTQDKPPKCTLNGSPMKSSGGEGGSKGSSSGSSSGSTCSESTSLGSSSCFMRHSGGIDKKKQPLPVFGQLKFTTSQQAEYQELNAQLPRQWSIYSIGGSLHEFDKYAVEKYDFQEDQWLPMCPLHQMDNDFTSTYDGRNSIYNFGGSLAPTKITRYDINEDRWETIETEIPGGGRYLHASVYDNNNFIYLLSGFPRSTALLRFNLVTKQFNKLATMKSLWKQAAVYDQHSNKIYAIGGCNMSGESVCSVDRYDVETDSWQEMAPLQTGAYSAGAAIDSENGYIYVFGGFSSQQNKCLNRIERYSIEHNKWDTLDIVMPTAMILTNACFFDGSHHVYLVGGTNPTTKESFSNLYQFDIVTFRWDTLLNFQYKRLKGASVFVRK